MIETPAEPRRYRQRRSYSQLRTYTACGELYRLERVARVSRKPGWWFPAGTAVHAVVEEWLTLAASGQDVTGYDVAAAFGDKFQAACDAEEESTGYAPPEWMTAGRGGTEGYAWWTENGPGMCQNFIDWYTGSAATVWEAPDGRKGIELDLTVRFGEVEVRVVIDLVAEAAGELIIVDTKTGSGRPDSNRQLGIYASAIELAYGTRPKYGTYFMTRGVGREEPKTYLQPPVSLSGPQYSVPYLTAQFAAFDAAEKAGVYLAAPGQQCRRCGVAQACKEVSGWSAMSHDPSWTN